MGFFKASFPRHPWCHADCVFLFVLFCLSSLVFVRLGKKGYFTSLALERLLQQSSGGFFSKVLCTVCFWCETPENDQLEKNWLGAAPSWPQTTEKQSQWEKGDQIHLLHLLWRGDQHQRLTRFPSVLLELLCEPFVLFFFFSLETGGANFFSPPGCQPLQFYFFFSLVFWVFCSGGGGGFAFCQMYVFSLWTMCSFRVAAYCWFWLWTRGSWDSWRGSSTLNSFVAWYFRAWTDSPKTYLI